MPEPSALVLVVDDDPSIRRGLTNLLRSAGFAVETFDSAQHFLERKRQDLPSCLILDLELHDSSGLDLQQQMAQSDVHIPIVFVTGRGDIPSSVRAMKAGALEFLTKPLSEEELLKAIGHAIDNDCLARQRHAELEDLHARFRSLTRRERQVMQKVVAGLLNKQVAAALGISEVMIKVHRGRVMKKMRADSLPALVRMAGKLGISMPPKL